MPKNQYNEYNTDKFAESGELTCISVGRPVVPVRHQSLVQVQLEHANYSLCFDLINIFTVTFVTDYKLANFDEYLTLLREHNFRLLHLYT